MSDIKYIFFKDEKEGVMVNLTGRTAVKYHPRNKNTVIDRLVEIVAADLESVKWTKWVREQDLFIMENLQDK